MSLRTPLARVRGLGAAGAGTHQWWGQRITAVALVPLTLWFVASVVTVSAASYQEVVAWVRQPVSAALLLMFVGASLYHSQLGMQVVVEDYLHAEWLKITVLVVMNLSFVVLGLIALIAILRVALGSP